MIEVRVEARDENGFVWVGHGVGAYLAVAVVCAIRRMPEGYTFDPEGDVTVTRRNVDPSTIHPDWRPS